MALLATMMTTESTIFLADEEATVASGQCLGEAVQALAGAAVIFLQGDLGIGKTTLCRGVLRAFGHQGAVKSPTYTLVEPYVLTNWVVNHFDLYRLGHPQELEYLGIRDYFGPRTLNLVEWPIRGNGVLPTADLVVEFGVVGHGRQLSLRALSLVGQGIIHSWCSH